jgi:outer membrane protein TolC
MTTFRATLLWSALACGPVLAGAGSAGAQPLAPRSASAPNSEERFDATLKAQPGGLTAEEVGRRAEAVSPDVHAKQRAVAAAAAKVDQAVVGFVPRLQGLARYVRTSSIPAPVLGNVVVTSEPGPLLCPGGVCQAMSVPLAFPVVLNNYGLQASLSVPISDYVLRLSQNHAAASRSAAAARATEAAARLKAQRDAKVVFYNWARARAGVVVAEQALTTAREHLKDVGAAFQVGTASRADVLRVESQVAAVELLLERARNLAVLTEEQLRTMLHDPAAARYALGEDLTASPAPAAAASLQDLYAEALTQRLEMRAVGESLAGLDETRRVAGAAYWPRLDGVANLYYQNPNQRFFPPEEKWHSTWDLGVQLTWTVNDTLVARSQVREIEARAAEVQAQRAALADGIRLEVTQALTSRRESEVVLATTTRQLAAAQESYRVRRDLFRAGRATSAELTDAEADLLRSRLDLLNARIDARIARVSFEHAVGRDVPRRRAAPES